MLRLLKNLKPKEWLYAVLSLGFIVLQVWLELLLPDYMQKITALAISNAGMAEIWKNGGIMLACALGSALGAVIVGISRRASPRRSLTGSEGSSSKKWRVFPWKRSINFPRRA